MAIKTHLTTAMASNAGSNFVQANGGITGTNITGTIFSNGISLSVANPGGGAGDGYNIVGVNGNSIGSAATIQFSNSNNVSFGLNGSTITASASYPTQTAFVFSNSNGVSFGTNGSTVTATVATNYQSQGAYLTTARASNDAIGLNTAATNVTWTVNSSGISLNAGAYLTTAAQSNHSHAFATTTTNGASIIVGTTNSNGVTIGVPAFLTTAQAPGAYLTTARASNDAVGLNTAQSNVTWTVNSSGISFDGRGYAGTNTTFSGTNVSASMTVNSAGVNLALSAGAGGGVTPVASASNGSFSFTTLGFSNANNVTFGTSAGNIITASVAAPGAAAENNNINLLGANTAGNTTASGSTIGLSGINLTLSGTNGSVVNISAPAVSSLVGTNGIGISTDGSTISISAVPVTASLWYPYNEGVNVMGQQGNATWQFAPVPTPMDMDAGYVSVDRAVFPMFVTNATNSTGTVTVSLSMGLYTKNDSSLSLAHSATGSFAVTFSGTVNNSTYAGIRLVTIPFSTSINAARYYVGVAYRTTTGGANATVSQVLVSQLNSNFSGMMGVATNRSYQWPLGLGVLSASSSGIPASVAFSQIDGTGSLAARPPSWHMRLGTV